MSVCPTPEKTTFKSERAAKAGLRAIKHPQGLLRPYRCGAHWHLGHTGRVKTNRLIEKNKRKRERR